MVEWKGYEPNTPEAHEAAAAYEPPSWSDSTSDYVDKSTSSVADKISDAWDSATGWVSDTVDSAVDKISDAWDSATGWVSDAADKVAEGYTFVRDTTNAWIDEKVWDTSQGVAELEEAIKEAADAVADKLGLSTTDKEAMLTTFLDPYEQKVEETTQGVVDTVFDFVDDKLGNINIAIDLGFDWLGARIEDLLEIPAMAFFKFLAAVTQPPEGGKE